MDIKASDVKALREKTGAAMMDCKKALVDNNGDFAKAEKTLKEMGLAAVAKRSGRATNEGKIFISASEKAAAMIELTCETDFVARNDDYNALGNSIVKIALDEKLNAVEPKLEAMVTDVMTKIKENMSLKRVISVTAADNEVIASYSHGDGKIGVIAKLVCEKAEQAKNAAVKEFAFDLTLHIAAFNPEFLDASQVNEAYLKEQEEIYTKQTEGLDKPANVIAGIVKGKLQKHLAEICLVSQGFVKDDKNSVEKTLEALSKSTGGKISIASYIYFRVGEETA